MTDPGRLADVESGREGDPFAVLGPHELGTGTVVRAFVPGARSVTVVGEDGNALAPATAIGDAGLFEALVVNMPPRYRLRVDDAAGTRTIDDPYRFGPLLGELDAWLLAEGNHLDLYRVLGAHTATIDGVRGTRFAVWAPNARRVSVAGDWNAWDGRVHPMRLRREAGVWELFIPGVEAGRRYKYELLGPRGELLPLRADPVAFRSEKRPGNASVVTAPSTYVWQDAAWLESRGAKQRRDAPIQIYEVHLGSWRRIPEQGDRFLTYRELAEQLIPYVVELGFTHIELLPITEHPFDQSWGYQTTGWFAPTSRFGEADDFRAFVDAAHAAGIAVILDWVPGHFPTDAHALGNFDGTPLYEHADPREGYHREWGTYVFNLARNEVANFLIASALYWLREFHVDGLRVDAVASLLYRDYSRKEGEWVPNAYGGRENLEAVAFLQRLNTTLYGLVPGIATFAEESTAWPGVTAPADAGGLGFGYKWNMGWMHDTLRFLERDPLFRGHHLNEVSFGLIYAFSENFVLPLSHDEVVHGKRSLLGRMPGARAGAVRQRAFALRAHVGASGEEAALRGRRVRPARRVALPSVARLAHRARRASRRANAGEGPQLHRARHAGAARARLRVARVRVDLLRRRAQRRRRLHPLGCGARRSPDLRGELQRRNPHGLPDRRSAPDGLPGGLEYRRRRIRRFRPG